MPKKRVPYFNYNTVNINGHEYFKAYVMNADKKLVIVYGKQSRNFARNMRKRSGAPQAMLFPDVLLQ